MSTLATPTRVSVIPTMRYRDPGAAIDWLCRAFGFERHLVAEHGGTIEHAQLVFDNGMIMLGPVRDDEYGKLVTVPEISGGRATQSAYVIVADADTHHARAVAAGARVVFPLFDADYGGRGYSCLDPEGHLWSFGTYDPWASN
jgi:uncharacterized glyoxalase superfamily protein PhnB